MVFVDDMHRTAMGRLGRMRLSHMMADTLEELHAMADRIGLARKHFQGDHYDVSMKLRALAVRAGAQAISMREMVEVRRKFRARHADQCPR